MPLILTPKWFDRVQRMWRWQRNIKITGDGVTTYNTEDGLTVTIKQKPQSATNFFPGIDIRITGHTQDGSNKRYKYDWEQVEKSTAGYGGWAAVSPAVTGHNSTYDYAYNTIEDINGATGTFGNGVASSDLSGSLDIQPVPNGDVVFARFRFPKTPNSDGSPELWFSSPNGVTGGCS